ncbi:MAG: carbohydrate ABC transporter permease [Sphaerochaetaceae bacterium]|nr:MAG: ABC transporter permease [Spirochaetes bacterium GWC2_52_13]HCG63812.1 sugar ABC transporter permease [Sphaerochaeta sp.]HCS36157.1 sugar ABC transporter permease [Sphaerochaeta sp.]
MDVKQLRKAAWIIFFVTPGLMIVGVFILLPLFMSLYNSLFSWNQLLPVEFVGLENFSRLFTKYPYQQRFLNALQNNLIWFLSTMVLQNSVGLLFGYLMSRSIPGYQAFKRIFFIPVLFSIIAVGFLWGLYLKPSGLVNNFLGLVGLESLQHAWLGEERFATMAIIMVNIWRWVGFPSLVFLAAIDNVPTECLEAAHLDGVGEWKLFWKIVFPLIIPSITIITVLTVIGSLNVFEQIYTMTGLDGGPNYSTDTIGTLFYRTAFGSVDAGSPEIGIGSAIGVVIYILTFLISLISIRFSRSREVQL